MSLQYSVVIIGAQTVLCYRIYSKTLYDPFLKNENMVNSGSALYGFAVLGLRQRTHACPASPLPPSYPLSLFLGELFNAFSKSEVLKPLDDLSHHYFYYFTVIQRNWVLVQSMFIRRCFIFSPWQYVFNSLKYRSPVNKLELSKNQIISSGYCNSPYTFFTFSSYSCCSKADIT